MPLTSKPLNAPWRSIFTQHFVAQSSFQPLALATTQTAQQGLPAELQQLSQQAPRVLLAQPVNNFKLQLVNCLQELHLPAWLISQVLSDYTNYLYCLAITKSLAQMQANGWGKPPVKFCWLQFGSGARYESLLIPDQDNGLILANYPDSKHLEIDTWMQNLGYLVTEKLSLAGIPLCKGHVMARWPLWRKRLDEWIKQLEIWSAGNIIKRVQLANIVLDFEPIYGKKKLAKQLRQEVTPIFSQANNFLWQMASLLKDFPPSLDRFDQLVTGAKEAPHSQAFNLKLQASLPLVSSLRLLALKHEISANSSQARLKALAKQEVLDPSFASDLLHTLRYFQQLLLTGQLQSVKEGRQADNWLDLRSLSQHKKSLLVLHLRLVARLVKQAENSVSGGSRVNS